MREGREWFEWFEFSVKTALVAFLSLAMLVVALAVYYTWFDVESIQRREASVAWRQKCVEAGGTLVPTEVGYHRGNTSYGGWVCAKLQLMDVK